MSADLLSTFKARYAFPLDDFQLRAIEAIDARQSVIVSAPTGAGKTLVAEFAIHRVLYRGRRIAYTTPLKALSNQKYADFCRQFGADQVGILTGDVKVNARAPVVVMTTEILRNMFYTGGLDGLETVVLDECHYMGDEGRGTVWEEIIVNCPRNVALVALSATVKNVDEIADWITLVHRPIVVVIHPHRPVPLSYMVADLSGEIHGWDAVRRGKVRLLGEERDGAAVDRGRWYTRRVVDPTVMLDELEARGWLPALYFIFSRAGCERAMETVLAEGKPLLARDQQRQVEVTIRDAITDNPTIAESPLNQTIFQSLGMGVGLHHAGILPSVKRLTELLFERGLCKVVFATETMSLGIHMPAKSVALQSLTKRTDRGFRSLTHNELTQMAGRAGRRGIDPEGKCVMALDVRDGLDDMRRVVDGPPEPIASQFKLGYGSVALLLSTGKDMATIRRTVESSFGQYQNLKRIRGLEAEVRSLEVAAEDARAFRAPCGEFSRIGRYRTARAAVEAARMARGRGGRHGRSAAEAEPGRLALVRRKSGATLGARARRRPAPPPHAADRAPAPRRHRPDEGGQYQARVLADAAAARAARLGAAHARIDRPDGRRLRRRPDGAREEPRARGGARRHHVPSLPVGLPEPLRAGIQGHRRARAAASAEDGSTRRLQERLLARVPERGQYPGALRGGAGR